jgi:hypothetical protein
VTYFPTYLSIYETYFPRIEYQGETKYELSWGSTPWIAVDHKIWLLNKIWLFGTNLALNLINQQLSGLQSFVDELMTYLVWYLQRK